MTTKTRRGAVTQAQANKMFTELRGHLVNAERVIIQIIETKAWEPLGYETFTEAWTARMEGVRLATDELRAHVVYAMFDDGATEVEVNTRLGVGSGVGPASVSTLNRQRKNGVPAGLATTRVREHYRSSPTAPKTLHVTFPSTEYERFKAKAKRAGRDVTDIAADSIREAFKVL